MAENQAHTQTLVSFRPPRWMRAHGGWLLAADIEAGRRLFHAYDQDGHALCEPGFGLGDGDRPTEGDLDNLCRECAQFDGQENGPRPEPGAVATVGADGTSEPQDGQPTALRTDG